MYIALYNIHAHVYTCSLSVVLFCCNCKRCKVAEFKYMYHTIWVTPLKFGKKSNKYHVQLTCYPVMNIPVCRLCCQGHPFMASLTENRPLLYSLLATASVTFVLASGLVPELSASLEVTPFTAEVSPTQFTRLPHPVGWKQCFLVYGTLGGEHTPYICRITNYSNSNCMVSSNPYCLHKRYSFK